MFVIMSVCLLFKLFGGNLTYIRTHSEIEGPTYNLVIVSSPFQGITSFPVIFPLIYTLPVIYSLLYTYYTFLC